LYLKGEDKKFMFRKKRKPRIINTGQRLPSATFADHIELLEKRGQLVKKPIMQQSRKFGTVIYGRHAVNALLGRGYHRDTYDFDIYAHRPRRRAIEIEQSIDRGTNSDLAFVEETSYPLRGKQKKLFRVKTRISERVEADFNFMPVGLRYVTRGGVRFETLGRADQKYTGMINRGELHRMPRVFWDKSDIDTFNLIKKSKKRGLI